MKKYDFLCTECSKEHSKWTGMCFNCGMWNSVVKKLREVNGDTSVVSKKLFIKPAEITNVPAKKLSSGILGFDDVVGGGVCPGSVIVLSGSPGVGKSSFLVNLICYFSIKNNLNTIYFSLEESVDQFSTRLLQREGLDLVFVSDVKEIDDIKKAIIQSKSKFAIVDSIQLVTDQKNNNFGQSSTSVKSVVSELVEFSKKNSIVLIFISQVVKSGKLAGPKYLEHMVDVVLEMNRDKDVYQHIDLVSRKNRYGSCDNVASFEFVNGNFKPVAIKHFNFSNELVSTPGLSNGFYITGSSVHFFRIQTLIKRNTNGSSRIISDFFKKNKIEKLCAIIEKVFSIKLNDFDFVISGFGLTSGDLEDHELAIASSMLSAYFRKEMVDYYFYGDVSLNGDVIPGDLSDDIVKHVSNKMNLRICANLSQSIININKIKSLRDLIHLYK